MNRFIKEQLKKCKFAKVPNVEDTTTEFIVQKINKGDNTSELKEGDRFKIEIEDYILNPPPGFDLHPNWNANIPPTDNIMEVEVTKTMGKMIKVIGRGLNDNKGWGGWLPRKSFKIIN